MMNAAYAVVIIPAVQIVQAYQMVIAGTVTVAAYQKATPVMSVMTVQAHQMVMQN